MVVSPLISLMKDQVDTLRANGVAAVYINSALSREEMIQNFAAMRRGEIKLVYVSPERLLQHEFMAFVTPSGKATARAGGKSYTFDVAAPSGLCVLKATSPSTAVVVRRFGQA